MSGGRPEGVLCDSARRSRAAKPVRGFILLEVVIAVALLLVGLTVIGAQINQSLDSSHRSEDLTRLMFLVESQLAELDTGLVNFEEEADNDVEGDFTTRFPDYGWRIRFDETATEELLTITLEILYNPRESLTAEFDHESAEVVHTVYTLRAIPPAIDLQADFGLDEEAIQKLSEVMPVDDFDPVNFDMGPFQNWPIEDLIEILPALMQAFNISLEELNRMVTPELRELLELTGSELLEGEEGSEPDLLPEPSGATPVDEGAEEAGDPTVPGGGRGGMRRRGGRR